MIVFLQSCLYALLGLVRRLRLRHAERQTPAARRAQPRGIAARSRPLPPLVQPRAAAPGARHRGLVLHHASAVPHACRSLVPVGAARPGKLVRGLGWIVARLYVPGIAKRNDLLSLSLRPVRDEFMRQEMIARLWHQSAIDTRMNFRTRIELGIRRS